MAKLQGATAGANMTGRKRQKFDVIGFLGQLYWGCISLGWRFRFASSGWRDQRFPRKNGLYRPLPARRELVAAVFCNRKPEEVKKLQEEVRVSMQARQKK